MATSILTPTSIECRADRSRAPDTQASFDITPSPYFRWKRAIDIAVAVVLVVPVLPLLGFLVVLVRLTSRGPGIYAQVRVGRNGSAFTMYKVRSMRVDAEFGTGAVWAKQHDPRVTFVGRILRKLHLDELPQLFNILKGEMSLVGPRPERPEFVQVLAKTIPGYSRRLAVAPGITGLAQVNLPPDTDLESVRRKQGLDLEYIQQASLWLDVRLAACTTFRMTKMSGSVLPRLFGVYRNVPEVDRAAKAVRSPRSAPRPIPPIEPDAPYVCGLACPLAMSQASETVHSDL